MKTVVCPRLLPGYSLKTVACPRFFPSNDITLEAMETLSTLITIWLTWRLLLPTSLAVALAIIVAYVTGPIPALAIAASGLSFGLIWQGSYLSGIPLFASAPAPRISKPVSFLGLAFIGALWGGLATEFFGSIFAAALFLICSATAVCAWLTTAQKNHALVSSILFASFSLLSGLGLLYAAATAKGF